MKFHREGSHEPPPRSGCLPFLLKTSFYAVLFFAVSIGVLHWFGKDLENRLLHVGGQLQKIGKILDQGVEYLKQGAAALQKLAGEDVSEVNGVATVLHAQHARRLITYEQEMLTNEYHYQNRVSFLSASSTKSVYIKGKVRVVAGYHIENGTSLQNVGGKWIAKFTKPGILAVEPDFTSIVIRNDEGWVNKISPNDYKAALSHWISESKTSAMEVKILERAEQGLREMIANYLHCAPSQVEIQPLPEPNTP